MQWHLIPTGRIRVDPGGPFGLVPRALWSRHHSPTEDGLIEMDMHALLIDSDGKTIVVDNGLGEKLSEKAQRNWGIDYPHGTLVENLEKHGVTTADVDIMLDTHLHSDHCGGNTTLQDGEVVPTFPNAEYIVQRMEFADAMNPDARTRSTYLKENYEVVWQRGQFRFLHGDTRVTSEVRCVVTPGHTRGHQSVIIEGDENPILYSADLATFAVHMARTAWVTAYDVEPLENIATKQKWQDWALELDALLVFEHDTQIPVGQLIKNEEGRLGVEAVEHPVLDALK